MVIRSATHSDLDFLVSLRNDPVSVAFSKRGKLSREAIHQDYFENSKKDVYIVSMKEEAVAYLIFEKLSAEDCEISIALAPAFRNKGLGTKIVKRGTLFALFHLKYRGVVARIFEKNSTSCRVFEKAGYTCIDRKMPPLTYRYLPQKIDALAVVFDFDGVLADSLSALYEGYHSFLKDFGYKGTKEEFEYLNGPSLPEIIHYLKERYSLPNTEEELLALYHEKVDQAYGTIDLHTGVVQTLRFLKEAEVPLMVATSSTREAVTKILIQKKIFQYFEFLLTGDDVSQAKPSPEIYEKAQEQFPDHHLLVLEDSANGLKAATAAGLTTIGFRAPEEAEKTYAIEHIPNSVTLICDKLFQYATIYSGTTFSVEHKQTSLDYDDETKKRIETIWKEEQKHRSLFNGAIISLSHMTIIDDGVKIVAQTIAYKEFLATLRDPAIDLTIAPLAVSGIIIDNEGHTLIAKRGNLTEYPHHWEFAPAGSIDASCCDKGSVDVNAQIMQELKEETGIDETMVDTVTPFALIYDRQHSVYDICMQIRLKSSLSEALLFKGNSEYDQFRILPIQEVTAALYTLPSTSTAKVLWANWIKCKELQP